MHTMFIITFVTLFENDPLSEIIVVSDSSKRVQPPNKKKHEKELEGYSLKIKQLEADLVSFSY